MRRRARPRSGRKAERGKPAVATRARPDPLFLLAGGPGQGAIESYAPLLGAFAGIRRERDLVLVDQRGTGDSNRLDCDMPDDALGNGEIPPAELAKLAEASKHAAGRKLFVAAGHGLNYQNVTAVAAIPNSRRP